MIAIDVDGKYVSKCICESTHISIGI